MLKTTANFCQAPWDDGRLVELEMNNGRVVGREADGRVLFDMTQWLFDQHFRNERGWLKEPKPVFNQPKRFM